MVERERSVKKTPSKFAGKRRRRPCAFCMDKNEPEYKDINRLANFITPRGKIVPKRQSAVCPKHQRALAHCVKRARQIGLIPYLVD